MVTQGKYYKKGNYYYVTYKETEITGLENTTTTLKIGEGKVVLMRFGQNSSHMVFEKGQRHLCYYETAYGAFTIGIFSNEVDIRIDDSGGDILVDYIFQIDGVEAGANDFYVQIREVNNGNDQPYGDCKRAN